MGKSIGIIETLGYTAALRAADMMVKMAYINVISMERIGSGLVSTIFEGDIESVKIALEVGAEAAQSTGELIAVHSIAKPLFELNKDFKLKDSDKQATGEQNGDGVNEGI
ncbi:propanediol utilization protein PduA [Clostridium polyendosporum]|uniref:Propanediol utilization protein PduA n=1 Tax=Clostridium polyendosporum TaxID=69208 RepID=A0A919S0P0_9CLOT|nr:BMC domain-containing protein [Clostridium polyendosporum]GIM29796.1 propanediol utilization protein PduA [Clostridium polyendosporum]